MLGRQFLLSKDAHPIGTETSLRACDSRYHRMRAARQCNHAFFGPVSISLTHIQSYAAYAITEPTKCKVVAIAEPRPKTRALMQDAHRIDRSLVFNSWTEFYEASAETIRTIGKRLADAVVVAVQDHMHAELVEAFASQGYHVLCEKPMATSISDCLRIETSIKKAGVIFGMGHGWSPLRSLVVNLVI